MESTFSSVRPESKSRFASAVFLYVFIGLLITGVVTAAMGFIFGHYFPIAYADPNNPSIIIVDPSTQPNLNVYLGLLAGSGVAYFILLIWILVVSFKNKGNLAVPFTLYAIVMGVLISSLTLFVRFEVIAISFGITCIAFGAMFCIGWFTKKDLSIIGMIASGLLIGGLLMALFNIIWMFVSPATFTIMNWVISYVFLAAIMLITIIDFARIKKIQESGEGTRNLALFCAFNLYVDFIYIFIRVLIIVSRFYNNK